MNEFRTKEFNELSKRANDTKKITKAFENNKEVKTVRHITTINERYKNQFYPGTNVEYKSRTITLNGERVEGVFPRFNSVFNTRLPKSLWTATDAQQEKRCNEMLKRRVENNSEFAKQFSPRQLEQIKNGDKPSGYTWHHNEQPGVMQLVNTQDHQTCRHTGGRSIWGGGTIAR